MPKTFLMTLLVLWTGGCFAQQDYFLIIQADNNQVFNAVLGGKALNSSDAGRLIIPQLRDSTYQIDIDFRGKLFPKQRFYVTIQHKDESFQLRNLGTKGWALANVSTAELLMPELATSDIKDTPISPQSGMGPVRKNDAFSILMAAVVNDSSVMYTTAMEKEPVKLPGNIKNEKPAVPMIDSSRLKPANTMGGKPGNMHPGDLAGKPQKPQANLPSADTPTNHISQVGKLPLYQTGDTATVAKRLSFVKQIAEQLTDSTTRFTFVDVPDKGKIDTIEVEIANEPVGEKVLVRKDTIQAKPVVALARNRPPAVDSFRLNAVGSQKEIARPLELDYSNLKANAASGRINKNCTNFATDNDIDQLRLQMGTSDKEDDQIGAAANLFKLKCFSVAQVRGLSAIFKSDGGKYKFFEAIYLYVSDVGHFVRLQDLLTDPYYIDRFKAMLR